MKVEEFCEVLAGKLERATDNDRLALAAKALQQTFNVTDDEVAFLKLDQKAESMSFLWPQRLVNSGSIPLRTMDSIAAATMRDAKSYLDNAFVNKRHASVFEQVKLSSRQSKDTPKAQPIQKIMSVPLVNGDLKVGVIQICRKASDVKDSGPDFSKAELKALESIAHVIARYL